jgi:hypothetical protein
MSRGTLRNRWLGETARRNVDTNRAEVVKRPKLTFGALLFYAFTLLPSNYLFIAYGLTTRSLFRIAIPFVLGRFVSYAVWARSAAAISGSPWIFQFLFRSDSNPDAGIRLWLHKSGLEHVLHQRKWKWIK